MEIVVSPYKLARKLPGGNPRRLEKWIERQFMPLRRHADGRLQLSARELAILAVVADAPVRGRREVRGLWTLAMGALDRAAREGRPCYLLFDIETQTYRPIYDSSLETCERIVRSIPSFEMIALSKLVADLERALAEAAGQLERLPEIIPTLN